MKNKFYLSIALAGGFAVGFITRGCFSMDSRNIAETAITNELLQTVIDAMRAHYDYTGRFPDPSLGLKALIEPKANMPVFLPLGSRLKDGKLNDVWGNSIAIEIGINHVRATSAGADGLLSTPDDLFRETRQ
jgi:hypothetical protein